MSNQITTIEVIQFHNQPIQLLSYNQKPYVAVKPICENIGLDWDGQRKRINRHHVLSQGKVMMTAPTNGGFQELLCLPISMINGWLFGVETSRVKPEIKSKLEQYQLECFDVLYNHFMPKVAQQYPNTINAEQQQAIKQAVNDRHYRTGEHYQAIYAKMYAQFNIPRYQEIKASQFEEVLNWLTGQNQKQDTKNYFMLKLAKEIEALYNANFRKPASLLLAPVNYNITTKLMCLIDELEHLARLRITSK